ncbi:MAG: type II/IV secretion system ATPase subunit [Candidatus Hadarchaeales archaeon]
MRGVMEGLGQEPDVDVLLLSGVYEHEYVGNALKDLKELAILLRESNKWAATSLTIRECTKCEEDRRKSLEDLFNVLYESPVSGVKVLRRMIDEINQRSLRGAEICRECRNLFLSEVLTPLSRGLESNGVVSNPGDVKPLVRPGYLTSRIRLVPPDDAELIDSYEIGEDEIRIYRLPQLQNLYHIIPKEYRLSGDIVDLLQRCRERIVLSPPRPDLDIVLGKKQMERMALETICDIVVEGGFRVQRNELQVLASSISRYTAGFGILEAILSDPEVQDLYVDAPVGRTPVHLCHARHQECVTNVYLSPDEAESLASKLRAISGRPFSEANPVLDMNLGEVRVSATCPPLSPQGLSVAFRRHKNSPWTMPQLIASGSITSLIAGLIGLIVDAGCTVMVTGTRGAGKTSMLSAMMFELLPKSRIITIEDTRELPTDRMRELGYKVQSMQVRSAVSSGSPELGAGEALRAALRMGDSVLVLGEVRGEEARILYEAMRVGASGNCVMGTIHGASARDVFDRVVHDLGISPGSFKSTDAIITLAPIRRRGSVERVRRTVQVTSVKKTWREDPVSENGFELLAYYDPAKDRILPSVCLMSGRSELISSISSRWGIRPSEVLEHVRFRERIYRKLCETAAAESRQEILEADFLLESQIVWRREFERMVRRGRVSYGQVFSAWKCWLEDRLARKGQ